jgi:hypothetical protein
VPDPGEPLSPEVVAFVRGHITSLLQLETLLLVFEAGQRPLTAQSVAAQMYLSPAVVEQWLVDFAAAGLTQQGADGFTLADSADVYNVLSEVADAYVRRRISLSRLVFESFRPDPKTSLSDAFRLRKEP